MLPPQNVNCSFDKISIRYDNDIDVKIKTIQNCLNQPKLTDVKISVADYRMIQQDPGANT